MGFGICSPNIYESCLCFFLQVFIRHIYCRFDVYHINTKEVMSENWMINAFHATALYYLLPTSNDLTLVLEKRVVLMVAEFYAFRVVF